MVVGKPGRRGAAKRTVLVTGSSDGLGLRAARRLVAMGHRVLLHARNLERAEVARRAVPGALDCVVADFTRPDEVKRMGVVLRKRELDAVIHNAGVYRAPGSVILHVNVLAPYVLTACLPTVPRHIYITSGLHAQGVPDPDRLRKGAVTYADSKFWLVVLAKAVARLWPGTVAHAVHPGWVPTKMGGPHAPDDLEKGVETQVWLAVTDDPAIWPSGRYWFHMKSIPAHPRTDDPALQEALLRVCAEVTGVPFPANEPPTGREGER